MKIPSKSNVSDVMSMGASASEQTKDNSMMPDFKSYMQQSATGKNLQGVKDVQAASKSQSVQSSKSESANAEKPKDDMKTNGEKKDYTSETDKKDVSKVSDKKSTDKVSDTDTASATDEVSDVDSELSEDGIIVAALVSTEPFAQVVQLIDNIRNQIQELLGIDVEEFNRLLESLDMQLSDLLDSAAQKQLFLAAENAVPIDLLTDEQLAGMLSQMSSMIDEAVTVSDMEATTIQSAIEQMNAMKNAAVADETATEDDVTAEVNAQPEEAMKSADGSHIRFTVESDKGQERDSGSFRHEQSDLSAMKEQVLGQLNQAVGQFSEVTEVNETVSPAEIVHQVVEEIKLVARQDTTSMELQLYPEHLGKVAIQVSSRNGAVTAQITAENEMARAALEGSIQTLKETFQNQGLKVEAIEVMVATSSFSQEQFMDRQTNQEESQSGKGTRRLNLDDLEDLEDDELLTEEEQLNVEMMRREGRNIDYTA